MVCLRCGKAEHGKNAKDRHGNQSMSVRIKVLLSVCDRSHRAQTTPAVGRVCCVTSYVRGPLAVCVVSYLCPPSTVGSKSAILYGLRMSDGQWAAHHR